MREKADEASASFTMRFEAIGCAGGLTRLAIGAPSGRASGRRIAESIVGDA